jgi:crotonobetainyl-CoA:carnitine CoA-transferase CaiB-like acyl-CoA transferase
VCNLRLFAQETRLSPDTPDTLDTPATPPLPLAGIRVAEFSHMVMGPMCGMVLADLGAEVIKVEPPGGDNTRRLLGSGAGFFPLFNRNKKSLVLDLQTEEGREAALRLVATADVLVENFKPETMRKLGLDHESLRARFPRLIHVSHKGFLPGPYDHRTALDEVVQMMGSSVNDIMGGMFGAIGVLAALRERERSGRGQAVQSALFENNIFLVAQHMLQYAVTGAPANPMPQRISPWGIYDVFTAAGGDQIFLAVVSDTQWAIFCSAMGWADWRDDARLRTNNDRVRARDWLIPELRARVAERPAAELAELFERHGLPFAPIAKPHELLDDPHLRATGGLAPITLPDGERAGQTVQTVPLPFTLGEQRLPVRSPPRLGADSAEVLRALGYDAASAERLSRTTAKG